MVDAQTIALLMRGVDAITWQSLVMIGVSFVLFYLAIVKDYEPLLLLPIGAGCMLARYVHIRIRNRRQMTVHSRMCAFVRFV